MPRTPKIEDVAVRGPVDVDGLPRTAPDRAGRHAVAGPAVPLPSPLGTKRARAASHRRSRGRATAPGVYADSTPGTSAEQTAMHIFKINSPQWRTPSPRVAFHGRQMTLPCGWNFRKWSRGPDLAQTYQLPQTGRELLETKTTTRAVALQSPPSQFSSGGPGPRYPEMRFVMTHRDPAKVVPSFTSLVSTIFPPAAGQRGLRALGHEVSEHLLRACSARSKRANYR